MDAVQQFAHDNWQLDIKHFMVTGASKRGWTTWLTAAADQRVNAIAPMVIDMLNMGPQVALQMLSFGGFSQRIHDYTDKGLQGFLFSPNGMSLQAIVDPYSYRDEIRQPKLIMLGTNDPYWPVDALNVYWDGLEGEKYICYEPNGVHGLHDYPRMIGDLTALHLSALTGKPLPKLTWSYLDRGDDVRLTITSDTLPEKARVWTASANCAIFGKRTGNRTTPSTTTIATKSSSSISPNPTTAMPTCLATSNSPAKNCRSTSAPKCA